MSDQLLHFFFANTPVRLDEGEVEEGQPVLLWKAVLRTGTWKLRPGPGGVKINAPLKIYRDKAPKGHISMSELVKNFNAGAKENVTTVGIHADGTLADNGFVRKLAIQDIMDPQDPTKIKESWLWAGLEITEPDVKKKIDNKTLVGCSGGILFDYQDTESGQKFGQILSHVMITNSPWIGGTGGYVDKLPEGIMAAEDSEIPVGELELDDTIPTTTGAPGVDLDSEADPTKKEQPDQGSVVWSTTDGFAWIKGKLQRALDDRRRTLMNQIGRDETYRLDYPYYSVDDVQGTGDSGKALICSGYGPEKESWVVSYSSEKDESGQSYLVIDAFQNWTPAKAEWVAASQQTSPAPSAAPAPARPLSVTGSAALSDESGLRRAQRLRTERLSGRSTRITTIQGGIRMGQILDSLAGVELSDDQRAEIQRQEAELERLRTSETTRAAQDRESGAKAFLDELKGTPFDRPGTLRYIESSLLSDDGGPALEFVELSETGAKSQPREITATDWIKGLFATFPKDDKGKLTLSAQAQRLTDDPKPPEQEESETDKYDPAKSKERTDALLAEAREAGIDLGGLSLAASDNGGGQS